MRKIKEGEYFAPKNKEEHGFILKSLRDLGYDIRKNAGCFETHPIIFKSKDCISSIIELDEEYCKTQITLSDLFEEETFEVDQKVLVRQADDNIWEFDRYARRTNSDLNTHRCIGGYWKFCIDYETNKDKHGKI